jgi:hypothetical protein
MKEKKAIYSFLIEFILMIFIFSLVSIISVSLFSKAKTLSTEANDYNDGLIIVENVVERMKDYDGEDLIKYLSRYETSNNKYMVKVEVVSNQDNYIIYHSHISYINKLSEESLIEIDISSIGSIHYE